MDDLLKTYEEDVNDSLRDVKDAEKEIEEAKKWHYKMVIRLANSVRTLEDYKRIK